MGRRRSALTAATKTNEPWQLYQVLDYYGALEATNTTNLYQLMAGLNGRVGISDWT